MMKHYIHLNMNKFIALYDCEGMAKDYPFIRDLKLVCNPRLKNTWGRAFIYEGGRRHGYVELSALLFMQHYGHRKETFIHELCHFIAAKHGDYGHGYVFKQMMAKYTGVKNESRFHQGIFDERGKIAA